MAKNNKYILVSCFTNINSESNNRVRNIFNVLDGEASVITTNFSHSKKDYYPEEMMGNNRQKHLHVPKYKKNVSVQRIFSHIVFAWRLRRELNSLEELPKAVYCTMPTSLSAYVCTRFCKKRGIKSIIDVIDIWPDSLLPLSPIYRLIKPLLYPWKYITVQSYRGADVILGESVKYFEIAKQYNPNAEGFAAYLGVDTDSVRESVAKHSFLEKADDEIWVAYGGSLGVSYDFKFLLESLSKIDKSLKYKFLFVGDGVQREFIENYAKELSVDITITGFLPYDKLLYYLSKTDIAINIFKENTKVVHSYKFNDYVATNCFILNSLEGETAEMVDKYKIGFNFNFSDKPLDLVLGDTLKNWNQYKSWAENNQKLVDEVLDRKMIYNKIKNIFTE